MKAALLFLVLTLAAAAQRVVKIEVDTEKVQGDYKPIYAYFGYDEPNYTYTANGKKLISELAALSNSPVYIRTHFLLATGDGTPGLKWGSTNAYSEDASGRPKYDWTIVDRILSTYVAAGAKPFVEIGFMPQALSSNPDPYRPTWVPGAKNEQYSIGWTYPPKDYDKWRMLVREWVKHSIAKWGQAEVASWYWEVWNEPDISYWHGTPEEYDKLYDYAVDGVKAALPLARVGGPGSTGPASSRAANFLKQFLEHCANGRNYATGATGAPLDFITFHAKGHPENVGSNIRMGINKEAADAKRGFEIVGSFASFKDLPIVLSEADPEGCAACSSRVYPQNAYRNGTLYPTYTALMLKTLFDLADLHKVNLAGMLTWAFEFEGQPYFDGFRTLATNGVDKPVLNVFRMAGLMEGQRVSVESSGRVPLATIEKVGVRESSDVDALATRLADRTSIMVWNYQDEERPGDTVSIELQITGLPLKASRLLLRHHRIDQDHSNSYSMWKRQVSPQAPSPDLQMQLETAGQLQSLESPRWVNAENGIVKLNFSLPLEAVSLIEISLR